MFFFFFFFDTHLNDKMIFQAERRFCHVLDEHLEKVLIERRGSW